MLHSSTQRLSEFLDYALNFEVGTFLRSMKIGIGQMALLIAISLASTGLSSFGNDTITTAPSSVYTWLGDLDATSNVKEAGASLMALEYGMWPLESPTTKPKELLIGVHDHDHRGDEWIYPLHAIDDDSTFTFFYRWKSQKPIPSEVKLLQVAIKKVMSAYPRAHRTTLLGHGCGGVLAAALIVRFKPTIPVEVHSIAAPLAGFDPPTENCTIPVPKRIPKEIRFIQWRTQQHLDDVFMSQPVDPQFVDIQGSLAVTIPEIHNGKPLGHRRALSYVADAIARTRKVSTAD